MLRRNAVRRATSLAAVSALALGCLGAARGADAAAPRKVVPNTKPMAAPASPHHCSRA
jgi:hypothetical protein